MKTNFNIFSLMILSLIIFYLIYPQSGNAQMFWNQACSFAGNPNSYIAVPNSATIDVSNKFTLEAWINPSSTSGPSKGIFAKGGPLGTQLKYGLRLFTGRISILTNGAERLRSRSSNLILPNKWTHIAATYDSLSSSFKIFINGVLDTTSTVTGATPTLNTDSLFIGISGSSTPYIGEMDEVRLWNKALSSTEISQYFRTSLRVSSGIYDNLSMSLTFQKDKYIENGLFSTLDWTGNENHGNGRTVTAVDQSDRPYLTITPNESVEFFDNDYLASPNGPLSSSIGITLECWVYHHSGDFASYIVKGPSNSADYAFFFRSFGLSAVINGTLISSSVNVSFNRWTHVAFTYNSGEGKYVFYIDGLQVNSGTNSLGIINSGNDSLFIGGGPDHIGMNGFMDEVRISNYAKIPAEIFKLMYQSIEEPVESDGGQFSITYNLDGSAFDNVEGGGQLFFRNNARFSHPGGIAGQPVTPVNYKEDLHFQQGYYIKSSINNISSTGTVDSMNISSDGIISDLNLFIALDHTSLSDLEIVLVSPNGDSVKVIENNSTNSLNNSLVTILNDDADSSIVNGKYTSFTPDIKPVNLMDPEFSGDNYKGMWKLRINDENIAGDGRLNAWGIQFNHQQERHINLTTSALIQGFYNPSINSMIQDTIQVILRQSTSPFALVESASAKFSSAGVGQVSFINAVIGSSYYIQLIHRNSIETWSKNPVILSSFENAYVFTTSFNKAFGNNMIPVDFSPLRYAIYSGDVNQDGIVDATDNGAIDNDAFNFTTGYINTDITGDNVTDASDAALADNNAADFVTSITPLSVSM